MKEWLWWLALAGAAVTSYAATRRINHVEVDALRGVIEVDRAELGRVKGKLDGICDDTKKKLAIATEWLEDADRFNTAKGAIMVLGYIDHVCQQP